MSIVLTKAELQGTQEGLATYLRLSEENSFDKKKYGHLTYWVTRCVNSSKTILQDLGKKQEKLASKYNIPITTPFKQINTLIGEEESVKFFKERDKIFEEKITLNLEKKKISDFIDIIGGITLLQLSPLLEDDLEKGDLSKESGE